MRYQLYIIAIIFIGVSSCKNNPTTASAERSQKPEAGTMVTLNQEQLNNAGIVIGHVQRKNLHSTVKLSGQIDVPPQSLVSISFPLGGYLKNSDLLPGTAVTKGQVIAVMEDQSYVQLQQDYLTAITKMEYLSADLARQKELSDHDAASKKIYQQALSEYKIQQVLIKALEEKLKIVGINPTQLTVNNISKTITIKSPINGYVSKVNVNIGKYVSPTDILFELVDPEDIHAAMTIFEKDILSVNKGLKGTVALADQPDKKFDVEVILITRNISENRTGLLHCHFLKPEHKLLPGMFLTGVFELNNKNVMAIEEEAVLRYQGKQYVFIGTSANDFELTEVETGISDKGYIEINSNNTELAGKNIVVKNAYALLGKLKNKMED